MLFPRFVIIGAGGRATAGAGTGGRAAGAGGRGVAAAATAGTGGRADAIGGRPVSTFRCGLPCETLGSGAAWRAVVSFFLGCLSTLADMAIVVALVLALSVVCVTGVIMQNH